MNSQLQNLKLGEIWCEEIKKYSLNNENFNVRKEIKNGYYSRVYFNNVLVAEEANPTISSANYLLNSCDDFAKKFFNQTRNLTKGQVHTFVGDGFSLKFVAGENIYTYIDGEKVFYRNYTPDTLGFLQAKFEAEKKVKELENQNAK